MAAAQLLAIQAQDLPAARWALGQRVAGADEAAITRAIDDGGLIRTHVLRPTWHLVTPADLRWLLDLTRTRVQRAEGHHFRQLGIDADEAARVRRVLERELAGDRALTKAQVGRALAAAGVVTQGQRLTHLLLQAETDAVICSGPAQGRQQTYMLVDERVPTARPRARSEALAEVARRYVVGHGPAQAADLAWWASLTLREARTALAAASPALLTETIGDRVFWWDGAAARPRRAEPSIRLLPNFDELLVAFRDRTDGLDPGLPDAFREPSVILGNVIVREGRMIGRWDRSPATGPTVVRARVAVDLTADERAGLEVAVAGLGRFLGRPLEVAVD